MSGDGLPVSSPSKGDILCSQEATPALSKSTLSLLVQHVVDLRGDGWGKLLDMFTFVSYWCEHLKANGTTLS